MDEQNRKSGRSKKMSVVQKAPEIREKEQNMPEESFQDTGVRREEMTVDTLKSVRETFLNPVEYALPDEMRTVRKEVFRTLGEARKRLQMRTPERITLNDMLLSSFNTLINQVQRAGAAGGENEPFPDERDAVWFMVQFEQCKLLATLTDLPVGGDGITFDMADITFFLANAIDLESEEPET